MSTFKSPLLFIPYLSPEGYFSSVTCQINSGVSPLLVKLHKPILVIYFSTRKKSALISNLTPQG
jgi:hypothetical protein